MYNFGLSAEQYELKSSLRRYLDGECSTEKVRKIIASAEGFAAKQWRDLGELGVLGLATPESFGGSGLSYFDLVVVLEALGRFTLPVPILESLTVANLIAQAGTQQQKAQWLPRIAAGEIVATFAIDEPDGYWTAEGIRASAVKNDAVGYSLHGTKLWVPYAHMANLLLCAVRTSAGKDNDQGISLFLVDSSRLREKPKVLDSMDDTYRLCEVPLDGAHLRDADLIGPPGDAWPLWLEARRLACVLSSAELLGCMERSLELIVSYSKERSQFGKLIGSYQAMKHRCADMLIDLEAARGSVYYAAWAIHEQSEDVDIAVASAKAFAVDAAVRCAEKALQSFGAIGFTWEHDIHLYLKRAKRLEMTMGNAAFHREEIAKCL